MSIDPSVVEREREYHNQRFAEETRDAQDKYYYAIRDCDDEYERLVMAHSKDAVVLDYGCALGGWALKVAPVAKTVHGIDISDVAIASATASAAAMGVSNAHFAAKDAQNTGFADNTFDLVFGIGIIHHLDTRKALEEVARVLKPGGIAIFREPLGCNVLINAYRQATPQARTPDEHPLVPADHAIAAELFDDNRWTFYGLTTLASVPLRGTPLGGVAYRALATVDAGLLRIPLLRWQGWCAMMQLTKAQGDHPRSMASSKSAQTFVA